MKYRIFAGMTALVIAAALMISAAAAQEATPEVTPEPETETTVSARPYLGVRIAASDDPDQAGALVIGIDLDSPAAAAGIELGDVITAINGTAVTEPQALADAIAQMAVGDTVTLEVIRDDEKLMLEAVLAEYPEDEMVLRFGPPLPNMRGSGPGNRDGRGGVMPIDPEQFPEIFRFFMQPGMGVFGQNGRLGVAFVTLDEQTAAERDIDLTEGALVTEVAADSPAEEAGLQVGDIITAVNGEPVNQEITLRDRLFAYEPDDVVTLTVVRAGETLEIDVTLGQPLQPPLDMLPFDFGQGDGDRGGMGGLLPPDHPPIPLTPDNPATT